MCEGVKSAIAIFCNNIINRHTRSTFKPLGSFRLPGTPGDQVPAQKLYPPMSRGFTTKELKNNKKGNTLSIFNPLAFSRRPGPAVNHAPAQKLSPPMSRGFTTKELKNK